MNLEYLLIKPVTPIRLGSVKPNSQFLSTVDYISGSVIRGALAEYMKRLGKESSIKKLVENSYFSFFYPSNSPETPSYPFPLTSLTCKNNPGFKSDGEECHGVFSQLIPIIALKELKLLGAEFPVDLNFKCDNCGSRMDGITGFYMKGDYYKKVKTEKFSQTKIALNRLTKTSEKGLIYSITALKPEKLFFIGSVYSEEPVAEKIEEALNTVGVGSHTTRGYGRVEAQIIKPPVFESLDERIKLFNETLRKVWAELLSIALDKSNLPKEPEDEYFTIDLLSPSILDDNNMPTLNLKLDFKSESLKQILFLAQPVFISGWSTAYNYFKPTTYGAAAGSVYVYKTSKNLGELIPLLEKLELDGIGRRRGEGYGEVKICMPFHREVNPI